jgi:hypothetical protein
MSLSLYEWVCKTDHYAIASCDLDAYVSIEDDDVMAEIQTGRALLWKQR